MFIKVPNYLAPNFTTEDFMIQVRGHLAKYFYGCHMTPVTRGALGYAPYQKGIIQGHLVHMYATRKASSLCSRVVFRAVLSLDVSTQTLFLCYMSVKYTLRGYFCFFVSMLPIGCYVNRRNQCDFSTLHRLYIYIYIYQMDCACQRYHKECSTRTCADDCYNCWKKSKLKSYVRPWFQG